ncbi:MAG: toxin-antitoxin system HicB family antitoxin [Clostridia bacterium]|nr:toxin-antitoxin system HicB family antitoxin [Clostridia bacterium]
MKYMLDISNELRAEIKYQAANEKISMNDLITKAVQSYLAKVGAK